MLKSCLRYAATSCVLAVLTLGLSSSQAQDSQEYLVKAAFIYNFTKFVEWPGDLATSKRAAIDICILGGGDMMQTSPVFKKASTPKLMLSLVQENSVRNLAAHCHVAFISDSQSANLAGVIGIVSDKPVLTVSDIEGFAEKGGMIEFTVVDSKVKLIINQKAITAAGLRVDAQLLEIALKVVDR